MSEKNRIFVFVRHNFFTGIVPPQTCGLGLDLGHVVLSTGCEQTHVREDPVASEILTKLN